MRHVSRLLPAARCPGARPMSPRNYHNDCIFHTTFGQARTSARSRHVPPSGALPWPSDHPRRRCCGDGSCLVLGDRVNRRRSKPREKLHSPSPGCTDSLLLSHCKERRSAPPPRPRPPRPSSWSSWSSIRYEAILLHSAAAALFRKDVELGNCRVQ